MRISLMLFFVFILFHFPGMMNNTGWQMPMLYGSAKEEAAVGDIPVEGHKNDNNRKISTYSWSETDTTLRLSSDKRIIWQYNFNTQKGKPYFHPISIGNTTITWLSPEDHPWHLGIWHSWKYINGVNYWEYDLSGGVQPWDFLGITEVHDVHITRGDDFSCKIELEIAYHEKGGPDLLVEKRKIIVSPPGIDGLFQIDYSFDMTAVADRVELNRTPLEGEYNGKSWGGYAGLSVRFARDLSEPKFINPDGSTEMEHGKKMEWKYYGLKDMQGNPLGVAIFDHPGNLNHPTPWFVTNTDDHPFYYFSPAPIFYTPHVMLKGDKLALAYRLKLYRGEVSENQLKADYLEFIN